MNGCRYEIALTIYKSMGKGSSYYTRSSINTIRKNLTKYHKRIVGRRWIFQCIKKLVDAGYITRRTRYLNKEKGCIYQLPSLFSFTTKGIKLLTSRCVVGAGKLLKSMQKWAFGEDHRWPKKEDIVNDFQGDVFRPSKEDFDKMHGIVTKPIGQN